MGLAGRFFGLAVGRETARGTGQTASRPTGQEGTQEGPQGQGESPGQSSVKGETSGAQEPPDPPQGQPLKPETGGTFFSFDAVGRGKSAARSALRDNKELERDYRRHTAARHASDPQAKRVSRSSFARNRSRPPKAVREAKGRGKGQPQAQAQSSRRRASKRLTLCQASRGEASSPQTPQGARGGSRPRRPGCRSHRLLVLGIRSPLRTPPLPQALPNHRPRPPSRPRLHRPPADDSSSSSSFYGLAAPSGGWCCGTLRERKGKGMPRPRMSPRLMT